MLGSVNEVKVMHIPPKPFRARETKMSTEREFGLLAPYAISKQETAKQALPSSLSFLGPYLSMTMPRGRVMALSRKEPTVKAKFSISSWALQVSQPFIQVISSCSCCGSAVPPTVPLVTISGSVHRYE